MHQRIVGAHIWMFAARMRTLTKQIANEIAALIQSFCAYYEMI
jgi:hypothetical protein